MLKVYRTWQAWPRRCSSYLFQTLPYCYNSRCAAQIDYVNCTGAFNSWWVELVWKSPPLVNRGQRLQLNSVLWVRGNLHSQRWPVRGSIESCGGAYTFYVCTCRVGFSQHNYIELTDDYIKAWLEWRIYGMAIIANGYTRWLHLMLLTSLLLRNNANYNTHSSCTYYNVQLIL